jgi:ribokinase
VLDILSDTRRALRVGEIAAKLNMSASAVSRLVATLSRAELVHQDEETGQCYLGLGLTVLGADALGDAAARRLAELGVAVHAERVGETRRAFTLVDEAHERTITTIGPKLRSPGPLPLAGYDAVFFVAGEPEALRSARAARFLAATPRELATLRAGGVALELLVGSASDPGERYDGGLEVGLVVATAGAAGGRANGLRYEPAPAPGALVDTYGAGDSFAAALCFALARGDDLAAALALAARAGAAVVTGRGPFSAQITS